MQASDIVVYGLGATAIVGVVMYFFRKISNASSLKDSLKNLTSAKEDSIKNITAQQSTIINQINASQEASQTAKDKIDKVIQNAIPEINNILKEDSVSKIDESIKNDWKNI